MTDLPSNERTTASQMLLDHEWYSETAAKKPMITAQASNRKTTRGRSLSPAELVGSALIAAWMYHFTGSSLNARFAPDEMMNIYQYWIHGAWPLLRALVLFPSTYYRPMGGVYYSALFHFFGLNPLPFHIVISALMAVNTFLVWRLVRILSGSLWVAGVTALIFCYHRETAFAYYVGSYIYDVLCFTFVLATLNVYVSARERCQPLSWGRLAVVLLLYVGALDSKEMAVSLPILVVAYEVTFRAPFQQPRAEWRNWLRATWLPILLAGAITGIYLFGKLTGPDSLITKPNYQPTFTLHQYYQSMSRHIQAILYVPFVLKASYLILLAGAMVYGAVRFGRKDLLFAFIILLITPLPVVFIDRNGAELLIPYLGWSWFFASLMVGLVTSAAREPMFPRARRIWTEAALMGLFLFLFARFTEQQSVPIRPGLAQIGATTWDAIHQLQAVQPTIRPGSKVIFLSDPFPGFWDIKFIAELVWRDHSVDAIPQQEEHLDAQEIARMGYIFSFTPQGLVRLKP